MAEHTADSHMSRPSIDSHTATLTSATVSDPLVSNLFQSASLTLLPHTSAGTSDFLKKPSYFVHTPANISSPSTSHPPIIVHTPFTLLFDTDNVDIFFMQFDAHYYGKNFNDEQLYYEHVKCLSPSQFHKISSQINSTRSYAALK